MSASIKNAIVFNAELPNAKLMEEHLKEAAFTPASEFTTGSHGFVPNEITGYLVSSFAGGYSITLRIDEKVIPSSAVNSEVDHKVKEIEAENPDYKVSHKERLAIKESVIADHIPTALTKTTLVNAYYHIEDGFLYIDTSSRNIARVFMGLIVSSVGSVKTETINVSGLKYGLTTRFNAMLAGAPDRDVFGELYVTNNVTLARKQQGEAKEVVNYRNIELASCDDLQDLIGSHFQVESISLANDHLEFKLDCEFKLKSLDWCTDEQDQELEGLNSKIEAWEIEVAAKVIILNDVVRKMIDIFKYQEDANSEDAKGDLDD